MSTPDKQDPVPYATVVAWTDDNAPEDDEPSECCTNPDGHKAIIDHDHPRATWEHLQFEVDEANDEPK